MAHNGQAGAQDRAQYRAQAGAQIRAKHRPTRGAMRLVAASALALASLPIAACATTPGAGAEAGTDAAQGPAIDRAAQTEVTRAFARAFLSRYFIERDFDAYAEFAEPDFIQHNPMMADGVAGHRAYFAKHLGAPPSDPAAPPPAHVIDMVLVDGDLFAVMHHSVTSDDKAKLFVDLWRVKAGKIAEHWDVIQDIPPNIPHHNGMACGTETYAEAIARKDSVEHPACGSPDPKAKREASLAAFRGYTSELGSGDVLGSIEHWFHPAYKQHSPTIADGKQGAIDYLKVEWGRADVPKPVLGPQRIVAEGDLVLVHHMHLFEGSPVQQGQIDIFRITDGKVSEHWDIKQIGPETSMNSNGMW